MHKWYYNYYSYNTIITSGAAVVTGAVNNEDHDDDYHKTTTIVTIKNQRKQYAEDSYLQNISYYILFYQDFFPIEFVAHMDL